MRKSFWDAISDGIFGPRREEPDHEKIKAMLAPPPPTHEEPWPTPPQKCGLCSFYRPWSDAQGRAVCKRNPPTVTITSGAPDLDGLKPQVYSVMYPAVKAEDWCGEFKRA